MRKAEGGLGRRWVLVAAVLSVASFLAANQGMRALVSSWLSVRSLRADLAAAKREERVLADRIAAAKGDDRALERAARVELGFQRSGEVEYRFPPPAKR